MKRIIVSILKLKKIVDGIEKAAETYGSFEKAHLYLWVPNALIEEGLLVLKAWGFTYKTNLVWYKIRKDGGPDRRGVGFYFRNVTELILFGIKGENARTLQPGRTQPNIITSRKREHNRKPDEQYDIIESCSWGPYPELFARGTRPGWTSWGNQAEEYTPDWPAYKNHSQNGEPDLNYSLWEKAQ